MTREAMVGAGRAGRRVVALVALVWAVSVGVGESGSGGGRVVAWGNEAGRNMVLPGRDLPVELDETTVLWSHELPRGRVHAFGQPAVAGDRVLVGVGAPLTLPAVDGNETTYRHAQLLCLDRRSGKLIWRLPLGHTAYGVCSTVAIEGDRAYVIDGNVRLICCDLAGMANGNDGRTDEFALMAARVHPRDVAPAKLPDGPLGDVIWSVDFGEMGVRRHDAGSGTPLVIGETVWVTTSHARGVRPPSAQKKTPDHDVGGTSRKRTPNVVVVRKATGEIVALDDQLIPEVYHGQWSSLSSGVVDGRRLVFWGDGYGVVHAFEMPASTEPAGGDVPRLVEAWRCDANPRTYRYDANGQLRTYPWTMGGEELAEIRAGGPGHIISTPVFHEGRLYVAIGRDRNYCLKKRGRALGQGAVTCIDPSGSGDVTDSHIVWRNTDVGRFHATPSIAGGRMYLASTDGHLYSLDVADGRTAWAFDLGSGVCDRSQLLADGKIYVANDRGEVFVFAAGAEAKLLSRTRGKEHFATPTPVGRLLILPGDRAIRAYATGATEGLR